MAATHGAFPSFLEMEKIAREHSLKIYDYLSQIQREMKAFLLIVRHNTEEATNIWLVETASLVPFLCLIAELSKKLFILFGAQNNKRLCQ